MMAKKEVVEQEVVEKEEEGAEEETAKSSRRGITEEDMKSYPSLEEATKNKPEGKESWELWQFSNPEGTMRWIWGPYGERALWWLVVEGDRWSAIAVDDLPTKVEVSAMLQALSPADRAELLKQFAAKK